LELSNSEKQGCVHIGLPELLDIATACFDEIQVGLSLNKKVCCPIDEKASHMC